LAGVKRRFKTHFRAYKRGLTSAENLFTLSMAGRDDVDGRGRRNHLLFIWMSATSTKVGVARCRLKK